MPLVYPEKLKGFTFVSSIEPSAGVDGDTWFNTSLKKVYIYRDNIGWGIWNINRFLEPNILRNNQYGFACGGQYNTSYYTSIIERISFPFDSGAASVVGNLSVTKECDAGGCNSSQYGYVASLTESASNTISNIERFSFPFDSGITNHIGNLSGLRHNLLAFNSSRYGYFCGGYDTIHTSIIDRILFPFDSGTSTQVGNLTTPVVYTSGCNSSQHGYTCGGSNQSSKMSSVYRIKFPFDSGTSTQVGNLTLTKNSVCSFNSSNYGYACGGHDGTIDVSSIDRIIFPFDSGTAIHIGNFSRIISDGAGCNSSNHGYACGGHNVTTDVSLIDRIIFPFDSGTASVVGNLSATKTESAGVDGTDFTMQFI